MLQDEEELIKKTDCLIVPHINHFEQRLNLFSSFPSPYYFLSLSKKWIAYVFFIIIIFSYVIISFYIPSVKRVRLSDSNSYFPLPKTNSSQGEHYVNITFPTQCDNINDNSQNIYLKYLETKSLPPRPFFQNNLTISQTNFTPAPEQFVFREQNYFLKKKFNESYGENSGVYGYESTDKNHSLVVKAGMSQNELLKTALVHQSNFAPEILFLGPSFMITENFGKTISAQKTLTENEKSCIDYLIFEIMESIHKEQNIYHCDINYHQIIMDKNFKLTIIDWGYHTQYVPGLNLQQKFICNKTMYVPKKFQHVRL